VSAMRIAYFSPLSPQRSGISDYSEELLPVLAAEAEIDLFVDGFVPANPAISAMFQIYDYRKNPSSLNALAGYDAILCQMGNSHRYHSGVFEVASTHPAIVVFHDVAFQHFFLERARELKDPTVYLDELEASDGLARRVEAEESLQRGAAPPQYQNPLGFPMNFRLANRAEGIIAHSEWSRSRLARVAPGVPSAKINLHVNIPEYDSARPTVATGSLSIASFGFITDTKGLESAIRALAVLKEDHAFHYHLVGELNSYYNVEELTRVYGIQDRVSISGYVDLEQFKRRILETDIAINLRNQTVGETSASLCRLMAAGVPTIVSNIGWFSELPDDCVLKVDPGPDADLILCAFLKELIANTGMRERIGANARAFILAHHRVEQTAADYLDFMRYVIARRARRRFFDSVSSEITNLSGLDPDELLLHSVASEITELVDQ